LESYPKLRTGEGPASIGTGVLSQTCTFTTDPNVTSTAVDGFSQTDQTLFSLGVEIMASNCCLQPGGRVALDIRCQWNLSAARNQSGSTRTTNLDEIWEASGRGNAVGTQPNTVVDYTQGTFRWVLPLGGWSPSGFLYAMATALWRDTNYLRISGSEYLFIGSRKTFNIIGGKSIVQFS